MNTKSRSELKRMETRAKINDRYQTAKWNARQSLQRTKDSIRAEINRPRKPIKLPWA